MEKVKLTFEKSGHGDKVTIQKDGGFSVDDMVKLTEVVEALFNGEELEEGEPDKDTSADDEEELLAEGDGGGGSDTEEPFVARVKREAARAAAGVAANGRRDSKGDDQPLGDATPPEGRGQSAGKLPDGTGITKQGTIDRRTLRGSPENPDPKQQQTVKRVQEAVKKGGQPEARQ